MASMLSTPATADVLDRQFDIVCPLRYKGEIVATRIYSIDADAKKACTRGDDGGCVLLDTLQDRGSVWRIAELLDQDGLNFHADFEPATGNLVELATIDGEPYTKAVGHCTRRALTPLPVE